MKWDAKAILDWELVESIDGLLDVSLGRTPAILIENDSLCYLGVHLGGTPDFVVSQEQAQDWIATDNRNTEVLFPFIGGDEIGQTPLTGSTRWIISFGERSQSDAETYSLPYKHLATFVKPERAKKNREKYPRLVDQWWKFWHSRNELYGNIGQLRRVLVRTRTTGNHGVQQVRFCPSNWVHTDGVIVFKLENMAISPCCKAPFTAFGHKDTHQATIPDLDTFQLTASVLSHDQLVQLIPAFGGYSIR